MADRRAPTMRDRRTGSPHERSQHPSPPAAPVLGACSCHRSGYCRYWIAQTAQTNCTEAGPLSMRKHGHPGRNKNFERRSCSFLKICESPFSFGLRFSLPLHQTWHSSLQKMWLRINHYLVEYRPCKAHPLASTWDAHAGFQVCFRIPRLPEGSAGATRPSRVETGFSVTS